MSENNNQKYIRFLTKISRKIHPRFSLHYAVYTVLFLFLAFSIVGIVTATTPNPGHPWTEVGDGHVIFSDPGGSPNKTYTLPTVNATLLSTGIGLSGGTTLIGGTATTDQLILRSTSGVGTTLADIIFQTGNNGATEVGRFLNNGKFKLAQYGSGTNTGTATYALQVDSSGNVIEGTVGVSSIRWDQITNPNAASPLSLTMPADSPTTFTESATTQTGFTWTSSTLTSGMLGKYSLTGTSAIATSASSGSALTIASTATGFTGATQSLFTVNSSGTNTNASVVMKGINSTVTNSGTTSTNIAGYFTASGATNNYAAIFDAGNVGIGTTTPGVKLHVTQNTASADATLVIEDTNGINDVRMQFRTPADTGTSFSGIARGQVLYAIGHGSSGASGWADYEGRPLIFYTGCDDGGCNAVTERVRIGPTGLVNIGGNASPTNMFSVGSSSQFQINSSGNIATIGGAAHTIANASGALSIDAATSGALNLNNTGTGDVLIAGGSGATGCTVTNSNGNLSCSGTISGTGAVGYWTRSGTNVFPATITDNVGVGDATPNSLFTVGNGDLFQINTTGQIGSQQAPVSDYLFALAGTTGNDHSRVIDITQADDADEGTSAITITGTQAPGTIAANRTIDGIFNSLTPSLTANSKTATISNNRNTLSLSSVTVGTTASADAEANVAGDRISITGTPTYMDPGGGSFQNLFVYGVNSSVSVAPTLTAVGTGVMNTYGGSFTNTSSSAGNSNLNSFSYGVLATTSGNLTTSGVTSHYGGYFSSAGTADTNYGIYATASGGTTNYAAVFDAGQVKITNSGATTADGLVFWTDTFLYRPSGGILRTPGSFIADSELIGGGSTDNGAFGVQSNTKSYFADEVSIGSTTDLGAYKLQVTKADTGQTSDASVAYLTNSGATFNTTAANRTSYGAVISNSSTESAGSNILSNVGLKVDVSGAERNSGGLFTANYSASTDFAGQYGVAGTLAFTGNNAYGASLSSAGAVGIISLTSSADYGYTFGHIVAGLEGVAYLDGAGTTADIIAAFRTRVLVQNSASATNMYSALIDTPDMSASGTITNNYGVYINDQKPTGVTNAYGVYQVGATTANVFAGTITNTQFTGANGVVYATSAGLLQQTGVNASGTTQCLTQVSSGVPTWGSCSGGGGATAWDAITVPTTSDLVLAHGSHITNFSFNSVSTATAFTLSSSSLTSGKILDVTSSAAANFTGTLGNISLSDGTGASSNTGSLLTLLNAGTANANTSLLINHFATGTGNLAMRVNDVSGDTTPFVIDGAGNVGINTTAPKAALHVGAGTVNPTLGSTVAVFQTAGAGSSSLEVLGGGAAAYVYADGGGATFGADGASNTWLGASALMLVNPSGNVSINSGSAPSIFNVGSTNGFQVNDSGAITSVAGITSSGSINPSADDTYNLGDNTHRFRDLYLGGETLHIGASTSDEATMSYNSTSNTLLLDNVASGVINVGTNAFAQAITIGNATGATSMALTTGTGSKTFTSSVATGTTTTSANVFTNSSLSSGTGIYASAGNSFTNGKLVDLQVSSTGSTTGQTALNILTTGVNSGTVTTYGGSFSNTHSGGTATNVAFYATASGGTNNYSGIFDQGSVGIGDITPASLFTVGNNDLFQINTTGQIGSQQAPQSDYLFALAGTTGNNNSRIIDITQANNSNEDSSSIFITGTPTLGSIGASNRNIRGSYLLLTPSATVNAAGFAQIFGTDTNISLSNLNHSTSASVGIVSDTKGNSINITGSPVVNDPSGANQTFLTVSGVDSTVNITPTFTSSIDTIYATYGGNFSNTSTAASLSGINSNVYGVKGSASGNLTTTGINTHYGGHFTSSGTADTNYGIYTTTSGATTNMGGNFNATGASTTNYGIYATASGGTTNYAGIFTGGNVGIGLPAPTSLLHVQQSADSAVTATPVGFDLNSIGAAGELTAASGVQTFARIAPTLNQTSTAGYTALLVNATETATGSGAKLLQDWQVGGVSKAKIDDTGALTVVSCTGCGGSSTLNGITAATAPGSAQASGTNGIIWNWALAATGNTGMTFGETTAASSGGTVFAINTIATSTASPLTITNGGVGDIKFNLSSTGDFLIQDNGTATASFLDTGAITFAPTSGQSLTNTLAGVGTFTINSGVTTGTTTASALALNTTALTSGTGFYAAAGNSFTNGNLVNLQVSSTGSTTGQRALNILTTGVNGTGSQTTYGAYISNTHSGTSSTNIGLHVDATTGTSTNTAAEFVTDFSGYAPVITIKNNSTATNGYSMLELSGGQAWAVGVGNTNETAQTVANKFFIYDVVGGIVPFAIDTSDNIGIGDTTPDAKFDIDSSATTTNVSGILATNLTTGKAYNIALGSALTTGGAINITGGTYTHTAAETGSLINLAYTDNSSAGFATTTNGLLITPTINTSAANTRTFNGISLAPTLTTCGTTAGTCNLNNIIQTLPALTQTTTNTFNMIGINLSSAGALQQNTAAGTINWDGEKITMPNVNSNFAAGTVSAIGNHIVLGTLTTAASAISKGTGLQIDLPTGTGSIVTGGTMQAIDIPLVATGPNVGTVNGFNFGGYTTSTSGGIVNAINIGNIGTSGGTDTAIKIGTGWDTILSGTTAGTNLIGFSNFTVASGGNLDTQGTIQAGSSNINLTVAAGTIDASTALTLTSSDGAGATSNGSGLEVGNTSAIGLLQGCADGEILKWTESTSVWGCSADAGSGSSPFGTSGGIITKTTSTDKFRLTMAEAGDYGLLVDSSVAPTVDLTQITNAGFGTTTADVDGLAINFVTGDGANNTNSAIDVTLTNGGTASGDIIRGLTFNNITPTAATEVGLYVGTGYDNDIQFADLTPTMSLADNGTLTLSDGSSTTNDILSVGTASSRGNALIYGDLIIKGGNIARSLTGVIDVFVYDTSGDVDGGDWRNSLVSLQMSWATESKDDGAGDPCNIASDDRCGNAAFPRKAIIATTASGVYIFDAADNSLWMKFTQAGTFALGADSTNDPSGVVAQNGVVVVGTNGAGATGMYAFDFKQDVMYRYNTTNRSQADVKIGSRNSTATYATNSETGFAIVDNKVNDVSINLQTSGTDNLANTLTLPLDSQAGQVRGTTLIAAATDTGVSVVNMGNRKTISYSDVTNDDYNQVYITRRGRMYATNETQSQLEEWRAVDTVSTTQLNGTPTRKYDELVAGGAPITLNANVPTISTSPGALAVIERASNAKESAATSLLESGDIVFVGTSQGLAEVHTSGGALANAAWSKVTTKDSATPYMVGDVRSMYLFDEASGATAANSAVGTGSTNNVMDSANATAPTFGGSGIRSTAVNFNNNSYLCSDANADGTCDADTDFNAGTTGFTVSLWFKHSVTAASDTLFERCYTPATPTVAVGCIWAGMTSTGAIKIGLDSITTWTYETTYDDSVTSTALYNDNQWHHMVYTNTDTDICLYIDGRQAAACDTSLAATATLDASQVLTIGGVCSGAACVTGTNFWDGSIDEFMWSSNGATTSDGMLSASVNKLYLDGRTHMIRPSAAVTDATTFSSTTVGDSGESYVPDSFAGLIVEVTGGTGAGQTRSIISNTATTFTVYPAWTTVPDTTTDYRVSPSKLYGSSNSVTSIAVDAPTQLNKARKVYVGTSDGADGGGVSVFSNAAAGGLKTEVYSSDSGVPADDFGTAWSGTNSDNISAISAYSDTVAFGTGAFIRAERKDMSMKQLQADMLVALDDLRMNAVAGGLFGATQDVLGLGQGADLAEYYYSNNPLEAGDVVAISPDQDAGIGKSDSKYQKNLLGIISTKPGLILGPRAENAYAVALGGRVPVKFTEENGPVKVGDLLTSSSRPGYAMRATGAGAIIGRALNEPYSITSCDAPLPNLGEVDSPEGPWVGGENIPEGENINPIPVETSTGPKCGYVMLFVGLGESLGKNVETLAKEFGDLQNGQANVGGVTVPVGVQGSIMSFLRSVKTNLDSTVDSLPESIFTDRIAAGLEILTPTLIADTVLTNIISPQEGSKEVGILIGSDGKFTIGAKTITLGPDGTSTTTVNSLASFDALTNTATFAGQTKFDGLSFFSNTTSFTGSVTFTGVAEFAIPPLYNKDTAGYALVKKGDRRAKIVFAEAYIATPVVNTSITFEKSDDVDDAKAETLFADDIRYIVVGKDQSGFVILLNKPATRDIRFSWNALSVKDPNVFESVFEGMVIDPTPPPTDGGTGDNTGGGSGTGDTPPPTDGGTGDNTGGGSGTGDTPPPTDGGTGDNTGGGSGTGDTPPPTEI